MNDDPTPRKSDVQSFDSKYVDKNNQPSIIETKGKTYDLRKSLDQDQIQSVSGNISQIHRFDKDLKPKLSLNISSFDLSKD